jgi:hypothetical protein
MKSMERRAVNRMPPASFSPERQNLENYAMRTALATCVALGVAGLFAPLHAQVVIQTPRVAHPPPGVTVETPYWRQHHPDEDWQARREFRGDQYAHEEWQRDHCVRDWSGEAYCQR